MHGRFSSEKKNTAPFAQIYLKPIFWVVTVIDGGITMETQAPKTPILELAWTRVAHLDDMSKRRTRGYHNIRRWIAILGVIATFLAIITQAIAQASFPDSAKA